MDWDDRRSLRVKISHTFVKWHKEGRDLGDYQLAAAFKHLRSICPDWDNNEDIIKGLAGSNGYTIYRMLRVKHDNQNTQKAKTDIAD